MRRSLMSFLPLVLLASTAEARFGKRVPGSSSGSSSTSSSSSGSGSGSSSAGSSSSGTWGGGWRASRPRYGYYSGAFVPTYGYGYSVWYPPPTSAPVTGGERVQPEPSSIRVTLGVEGLYTTSFTNGSGYVLGANALLEGDRFGVSFLAQTIQTQANQITQLNVHLTYAFLTGRHGRLRGEFGLDTFFARELIVVAPTGGFSGQLWIAGPLALEASLVATPWPIWQVDGRAGVVLGIDSVGIRAGWRTQLIEDRGLVPGIPEDTTGCAEVAAGRWSCRDIYGGPYVGVGIAL